MNDIVLALDVAMFFLGPAFGALCNLQPQAMGAP